METLTTGLIPVKRTNAQGRLRCSEFFVRARRKLAKKRSLHGVNEHFELIFNAAMAEKAHSANASAQECLDLAYTAC
jgi:hypothetical protein